MQLLSRLERPRRIALVAAVASLVVGLVLAVLAPEAQVPVPMVPTATERAPRLTYVRSLPDAGDAPLVRPVGLALGDGRVYVSDSEAAVVRVFSTAGFDLGEIGRGVLAVPAYLASDNATGTILVADRELGAILRFAEDGERLNDLVPSTEPTVPAAPWEPLGIAVDGKGAVAVTDSSGRHRMMVMSRSGSVRFSLGSADATGVPGAVSVALDYPNSVAFAEDAIWVSDSNNMRVLVFDRDGSFRKLLPVDGIARGITFLTGSADESYVAVVDALASDIVLLDTKGAEITRYGSPGSAAGQLAYPNDVVYDPDSEQLFVADTGNARVQVWSVKWPSESTGLEEAADRPPFSPMRMFGLILAMVGMLATVGILWLRRQLGAELANIEITL